MTLCLCVCVSSGTQVAEDGLGRALAAALAASPGKRPLPAHAAHALRVGDDASMRDGEARECLDQVNCCTRSQNPQDTAVYAARTPSHCDDGGRRTVM